MGGVAVNGTSVAKRESKDTYWNMLQYKGVVLSV